MLFGICLLSIVPMRAEPKDTSELVSQVIYGESFKIIRTEIQVEFNKIII